MVAAGILTIIGLATATLITQTLQASYRSQEVVELTGLMSSMRASLDNQAACTSALAGQTVIDGGAPTVALTNLNLSDNTDLPKYHLFAATIRFRGVSNAGTNPVTGRSVIRTDLAGRFRGQSKQEFGERILATLFAEVDGSNRVVVCSGQASPGSLAVGTPPALCLSMGGSWSGSSCNFVNSTPPNVVNTPPDVASICSGLGGSWSGSACALGTTTVASAPAGPTCVALPTGGTACSDGSYTYTPF